ncbi:Crp/Fnr family transcriptional regulator [Algoriphagus sp. AGSA1]|uniref:Crp/Fnr family transcriptional regulator n=1 Tax=Algoriphagus sp. AGSA1 TaxID=2907213 RepID=UPI001F322152|nr:Crp/Fnr family transcriptional regulator [Algoriphagus sp. AGSA1]MCE7054173.1 Crp/Fnr family transcriptional regulator [Algoriphagus sp. AGSA1]
MKSLHNYFNRYTSVLISDQEFEYIFSHFTFKKIKRKQFLLSQGEVFSHFSFLLKGAMRKYFVDDKGKEHVVNLYIENWWPGDRESFVLGTPSAYNIVALEDCELLMISKENTTKLCRECPVFAKVLLKLDEKSNIASQKRIVSNISSSAKDRYEELLENYPEFLQRFPQHHIASYLGITKDTLSRIRKQLLKE